HLPDAFATGSSMMPQKKNADVAELARGRTGRVYGQLLNLLTNLKGQPLAYNRDLQEDKIAILDAASVVIPTLTIFAAMVPALDFDLPRMRQAAGANFSLATDVADYLVKKGMPFRTAHEVVGSLVRECELRRCELNELPFETYADASALFEQDILDLDVDSALAARDLPGGTAPARVRTAAAELRSLI
ncbi:MAG: lyase family protein, partial [Dehalococcoidia bacterium]|nr:lyase family protein [Dehalococcoidia bacterium]